MRLCTYTMVKDTGFAPNPFWGYCTLAACTPNHQGIVLEAGDWIAGNSSADQGHRLIYAMRVSEVLDFNDYFNDPRFQAKKPIIDGSAQEQCGDNIYFRSPAGGWKRSETLFHDDEAHFLVDTKNPRVFISTEFFYFGAGAIEIPARFTQLIAVGRGCRCNHAEELATDFVTWLQGAYRVGIHGEPRDIERRGDGDCQPCR